MVSLSGTVSTAKAVKTEFSEKNVTFMAGSIAYSAFLSLVPLLVVVVLVATLLGGQSFNQQVLTHVQRRAPGAVAQIIERMFQGTSGAAAGSVIGIVTLLWGTLKVFRNLDTAFSEIYETTGKNDLASQIKDGVIVLGALTLAVVATIVVNTIFGAFADALPFLGYVTPLVLIAGLGLAFLPMYYFFPDADVEVREIIPGVAFAAVGWALLQGLFQVYLVATGRTDPSDVLTGIVVLITWLYFSGLVMLLGAVINAVLGEHATGAAGGIGKESGVDDAPERTLELSPTEAASYLSRLREDLTGRYEWMRPTTDDGRGPSRPRLTGSIEVEERRLEGAGDDGDGGEDESDGPHWEIKLRYPCDEAGRRNGDARTERSGDCDPT